MKFNLKIFSINSSYYELIGQNFAQIVNTITQNHKKHLHASGVNYDQFKSPIQFFTEGDFTFANYCYNERKNQNYWTSFLPSQLAANQNFDLIEFSHVLFINLNQRIYCVVSGSGITVVKKYLDNLFGIEFYQHFANLNDDIALSVQTRGITGNLLQRINSFNYNQSVKDSLLYSEIPKKLKLIVRKELRDTIFKDFKLTDENAVMEIGSYFSLRKRIDFQELKMLLSKIDEILDDSTTITKLSLFNRVKDNSTLKDLRNKLIEKIVENVLMQDQPALIKKSEFDIVEIVNYKAIEKFYECNSFLLHFYKKKKKDDISVIQKDKLYFEITKTIYENLENINDIKDIKEKINQLSIIGLIDKKEVTYDYFYNHIVTELELGNHKYFKIDNEWFELENNYLTQLKEEAINNYSLYELKKDILNAWENGDEDTYNLSHKGANYYVFDKKFSDNIELCDIMFIDNNEIFLVHVKDGFNTHMRSLYSQILISAQRLWNDINNVQGSSYLKDVILKYNKKNPTKPLDFDYTLELINKKKAKITFVMAYRNQSFKNEDAIGKIKKSTSNIAIFSIVQTVREILNYQRFELKIIDISQIK